MNHMTTQKTHWEDVYTSKASDMVSWYTPHLDISLQLVESLNLSKSDPIIDIGGGASTLMDDLVMQGYSDLTALDISGQALEIVRSRIGHDVPIEWIEGNILTTPLETDHYRLWHDRAVFHFLTEEPDRVRYVEKVRQSLVKHGHVIMAPFSQEGPLKCSGLDIVRYSDKTLHQQFGSEFRLISASYDTHITPAGNEQKFVYAVFQKK